MKFASLTRMRVMVVAVLLLMLGAVSFVVFAGTDRPAPFFSSELGIAQFSPKGPMGGAVMPASGGSTPVTGAGRPTCTMTATPSTASPGQSVRIDWSIRNASEFDIRRLGRIEYPENRGAHNANGSVVVNPTVTTAYNATVWQFGITWDVITDSCSVTVNVGSNPPPPSPTINIWAVPNPVAYRADTTVFWSLLSGVANSCTVTGPGVNWSASNLTGPRNFPGVPMYGLTADRTYTMTCDPANPSAPNVTKTLVVDVLPLNGQCGGGARTYSDLETGWSGSICAAGTPSPNPSFPTIPTYPTPQNSSSWTCLGANGGSNQACTAYRNAPPECSDGGDNDSDTNTDYPADIGCSDSRDNDERLPCVSEGIDTSLDIVRSGDPTTLTFTNSTDAATCELKAGEQVISSYFSAGACTTQSYDVNPTHTTIYTLECNDAFSDGGTSESVTVQVLPRVDEN